MVRIAVVLIAALGMVSLFGGGIRVAEGDDLGGKARDEKKVVGAARIVCGPNGTRVLTPEVRAHAEGVRLVIENRYEADTYADVSFPDGSGGGEAAPMGKSESLTDAPPGKVRIGCEEPPVDGIGKIDYASFRVVDPKDVYKSLELECPSGTAVIGTSDYPPGTRGEKGKFVERTRQEFSDSLMPGDRVERAGYQKDPDYRYTRVVRDGRVTATISFRPAPGGWLEETVSFCTEF